MKDKFEQLIQSSNRILITSHISPDPDAVASLLLMGSTLKEAFKDKQIHMILEEEPYSLDFMDNYSDIEFTGLLESFDKYQPELFILLDGNNYSRASRLEGNKVRDLIKQKNIKTTIIDHHEIEGKENVDLFINNHSPATVVDVYDLLFNLLNLKKPANYAQTAMIGLYSDTGGFVYLKDGKQDEVFDLIKDLVNGGANIEQIKNQLSQYSEADMWAFSELAANTTHDGDYSYSFIGDKFIESWLKNNTQAQLQKATGIFLDCFIRNIDGRQWGFIVYKNTLQGDNFYSASFRAVSGTKDVAAIANKLGGGGHKPAAGARFEASSVKEAIEKIKQTIMEP